jgi:hypothetical protein
VKKSFLIILFLIAIFAASCRKDTDLAQADMGYGYFPVNPGHWVAYKVDSTSWDDFTDSVYYYSYQVKEIIESEFIDNEGRNTLRIERYKRLSDTNTWTIKDVWYANLTTSTAERVEENIRFVKLIFPLESGAVWNGNAYNSLGSEDYTYDQVNAYYSAGIFTFDSTLTVLQRDETTYIRRDYSVEVYAKYAGLIYKRYIDLSNPPNGKKKGIDYTYTVMAWGD